MSVTQYPRLMVATEFPPNASGGGPAVIRQMLKGWPVERLAWWSCLTESGQQFGQSVDVHRVAKIPAKLFPHARLSRSKAWVLEHFWARWAAGQLQQAIKSWEPEVVWAIPQQWSAIPMAVVLPHIQCGLHVTLQDYMDAAAARRRLGDARACRLAVCADTLYRTSKTRDATSHPMIEDLLQRTSRSAAQMLHAGLEEADFRFLETKVSTPRETIQIAHAGTIIVEDSFATFVEATKRARADTRRRVELHLFGAHSYRQRSWFDPEWMVEHGNLPEAELLHRLRDCDWGVSPMALDDDDPRYNRFSFPTKFITYLASGLPVIALGHRESSVVKMARQYHVGICSEAQSVEGLAAQLRAGFSERDPWTRYRGEIARCARTEFDAARIRETLTICLRTAAGY